MCQLTDHTEYLVPHSTCPLIDMSSIEIIKEQTNTIEGKSPEELTLDEQGSYPEVARHQQARGRAGWGLLALGE